MAVRLGVAWGVRVRLGLGVGVAVKENAWGVGLNVGVPPQPPPIQVIWMALNWALSMVEGAEIARVPVLTAAVKVSSKALSLPPALAKMSTFVATVRPLRAMLKTRWPGTVQVVSESRNFTW